MEAIALLQEWVQTIGSQAGLTDQNATILSGAVGVPESRLEASICSSDHCSSARISVHALMACFLAACMGSFMYGCDVSYCVQLEIELDSLAQLESFWGQIAPQAHKAWSQRAQVCTQAVFSLYILAKCSMKDQMSRYMSQLLMS